MKQKANSEKKVPSKKQDELEEFKSSGKDHFLTTNQGVKINDDNNSLKVGSRGSALLEDFILREKITHFDHERIPERVVHARGSGAHGYFELYKPLNKYTKAKFLNNASVSTPVFVRISTVAGSRGSTDLARDVRGFAIKFYTEEGIYDLVGNNMPVFFIQDAMKFPDLVHAVKGEPHNEIPQAASAHDTFWDFISLMPESMHMIMWTMSDRAIPRSLRMMEGFGVHTFRFINENNESHFVKFHWKPKLGTHAVLWDEAQKISGKNSDFHKQDLWDAIDQGNFPEWELGVQIIPESDEHKFEFDLLDPTKLVPEELVPVTPVGKIILNKNPDNFFAETEQVAFHPGHIVPGIDFTNDPLLQGRLFSYTDTQLSRLGSPNFHEIPINKSISPVHNNQRDAHMRQEINIGKVAYFPNSLEGGCPFQSKMADGGFTSYDERIEARKVRERSESFADHFSQAQLFYDSQTDTEQNHIIKALRFELGKVKTEAIRLRTLSLLAQINEKLAAKVAEGLGLKVPKPENPINKGVGADAENTQQSTEKKQKIKNSDALSMIKNPTLTNTISTRQVAFLCAEGVNDKSLNTMKNAIEKAGGSVKIIAPNLGEIIMESGAYIKVDQSYLIAASVLFDATFIPDGANCAILANRDEVKEFINDSFKHCKYIAAEGRATVVLENTEAKPNSDEGVLTESKNLANNFIQKLGTHRFWKREKMS